MDLLNSILNSMDAPPSANEKQKELLKKQREQAEKLKNKQKQELLRFRKYVEERIGRFAKDDRLHIEFQPLDKVHRAVIHEVSEYGGFIAMSFGREDVDRYTVVYKKENGPSEDEVAARRNGDGWNDEIAKEYAEQRKLDSEQKKLDSEHKKAARAAASSSRPQKEQHTAEAAKGGGGASSEAGGSKEPPSNYKDKYVHLIGQEAALDAARKTETNHSYGFVPSKNKKDMRSIEQTLADIQAKKRRKLQEQQDHQQPEPSCESPQKTEAEVSNAPEGNT